MLQKYVVKVFLNNFSFITQFMTFESYPLSIVLGGYFHFGNNHFLFLTTESISVVASLLGNRLSEK